MDGTREVAKIRPSCARLEAAAVASPSPHGGAHAGLPSRRPRTGPFVR